MRTEFSGLAHPPTLKWTPPKIYLALGGGGAWGAHTWGVLDAMFSSEFFDPDRVELVGLTGTSAGGFNAVSVLDGYIQNKNEGARSTLNAAWKSTSHLDVTPNPYSPNLAPWKEMVIKMMPSGIALPALKETLENTIQDWEAIQQSSIDLSVNAVTYDLKTRAKSHILYTNPDITADHIVASAALLDLGRWTINGIPHADGAYMHNIYTDRIPSIAQKLGATDVIFIKPYPKPDSSLTIGRKKGLNDNILRKDDIKIGHETYADIERISRDYKDTFNTHVITQRDVSGLNETSRLNTEWSALKTFHNWGYEQGEEWLERYAKTASPSYHIAA